MWRLTDKTFSREWRRSKSYALNEIKHLARRRRCTVEVRGPLATVTRGGAVVANFVKVAEEEGEVVHARPVNERLQAFAALKG